MLQNYTNPDLKWFKDCLVIPTSMRTSGPTPLYILFKNDCIVSFDKLSTPYIGMFYIKLNILLIRIIYLQ